MAAGRACVADQLNLKGECLAAGEAGSFVRVGTACFGAHFVLVVESRAAWRSSSLIYFWTRKRPPPVGGKPRIQLSAPEAGTLTSVS